MKTLYEDRLVGRITTDQYDEYVNDLESRQQELNDRLKMLTSDNKSFQLNASYLLDLAQRAEQLFKESDEVLQNKLLEYVLSNIELKIEVSPTLLIYFIVERFCQKATTEEE